MWVSTHARKRLTAFSLDNMTAAQWGLKDGTVPRRCGGSPRLRTTLPHPDGGNRCAGERGSTVGGAHTAHAHSARFPVAPIEPPAAQRKTTNSGWHATLSAMRVRELLAELQHLPRDLEVLAFEAGCEDYCEREVDELELQRGRVYLHLGTQRDEPPRR